MAELQRSEVPIEVLLELACRLAIVVPQLQRPNESSSRTAGRRSRRKRWLRGIGVCHEGVGSFIHR